MTTSRSISEAIGAKGCAFCVEEQLSEARLRPADGLHPVNAVTGIAKGAAGQAGAIGQASAAAGT